MLGGTPTALGYDGEEDVTIRDPAYPSAAAGVVATIDDVSRFLDLLAAGKIIDREQTKAMETVRADVDGEHYGLGLLVRDVSCGTAYGQVGENRGYAVQAWTVPDKARTIVVTVTSGAAAGDAEQLVDSTLCR
jgi:D-alanyl-D-alanine carboxypeptidase